MTTMPDEYPETAEGICHQYFDTLKRFQQELRKGVGVIGLEAWLVKYGGEAFGHYQRPAWLERMKPNHCFMNCYQLVVGAREGEEAEGLRYYEGFVMMDGVPVLIHHAWCVDKDSNVVEPTLPEDRTHNYYGVHVPLEILLKTAADSETYGILDKPIGIELLEAKHADAQHQTG